jgi:UTP--glucose-1-phosphate uridylyltransferase
MKAIIPAAGLGTRLLPATKAQPKEMLIIAGKPIIHWVVREAVDSGITDIVIITGRHKRAIEEYFDSYHSKEQLAGKNKTLSEIEEIERLGAHIYYRRQPDQLGLGDAILRAEKFIGDEHFAILLGDTVFTGKPFIGQLLDLHKRTKANIIGTDRVAKNLVSRYGVLDAKKIGNGTYLVRDLVEKPPPAKAPSNLIIAARYILSPTIFDVLKQTKPGHGGELQLTDGIRTLIKEHGEKTFALLLRGKHYDIGDHASYRKAFIEFDG